MKKLLCMFFAAILSVCTLAACGGNKPQDDNPPATPGGDTDNPDNGNDGDVEVNVDYSTYGSFWLRGHDYKTMPITAFNACPPKIGDYTHNYLESEQTFKDYAQAHVNTMMGMSENTASPQVEQALDWCAQNGISYLVACGGADNIVNDSIVKSTLMRVKYHDAFGGVMQFDEPGRTMFENLAMSKTKLDALMPAETVGALWHCNLFPLGATERQLYHRVDGKPLPENVPSYTFEQYVSDYMEICKPQVLSYDNYPLRGAFPKLSNTYFTNMSIMRRYAKQANVPFWVYVQACKFSANTRIPNEAEVKWLVNTSLSYGAKGIQYFTGVLPNNNASESFEGGLFDRNGNKTEVYEHAKKANAQVAAVDEILMCSHSEGVMQIGTLPNKETLPESDLLSSYGVLESAQGNHSLIGCFDYNEKAAYYVTNNSLDGGEELTLNFNKSVSGYIVQGTKKTAFSGNSLKLDMAAGDGVLVVTD